MRNGRTLEWLEGHAAAAGAQVEEAEGTVCLLNARNACWRAFVFSEKDLVTVCDALQRKQRTREYVNTHFQSTPAIQEGAEWE